MSGKSKDESKQEIIAGNSLVTLKLIIIFTCFFSITTLYGNNKKSLVIGIDGLGYGKNGLNIAYTPNINSLIDGSWAQGYNGAYSERAYTGGAIGTITEQTTKSGPGWSTVLTGVWGDRHNVVSDNLFLNADFENNPTYLETLEELIPKIKSISIDSWSEIYENIIPSINDLNSSIDIDTTWWGGDWWTGQYFYNAGDTTFYVPVNGQALKTTITHLNELDTNSAAIFIQFVTVDWAGHWWGGSSSTGYQYQIEEVDSLIGHLLTTIRDRFNFQMENWQIILTSDHGFLSEGEHGGQSELERRVPFIVSSKFLNKGILDSGIGSNISIADVAPTVLDHFGLDIPDYYAGVSRANGAKTLSIEKTKISYYFSLHQNYPNPFNPVTTINYDLPQQTHVNLMIYDILGREVVNLVSEEMPAGYQSVIWNTRNSLGTPVSAGIYFYQIQTKDFVKTRKMVLLK